jgi:hypothetical protein
MTPMSWSRLARILVAVTLPVGACVAFSPLGCSSSSKGEAPIGGDGGKTADTGKGFVGSGSGTGSNTGSGSGSGSGSGTGTGSGSGSGSGCTTNTGPISGSVTASGGSISRLVFAVVGDTRPANEDDVSGYPTSIITTIFSDIQKLSPLPPLVLATGDYQFSSTGSNATGPQQVGMYMQTRATYSGAFFPAMGNHECGVSGGFTTSDNNNCGPGNQGGVTPNYMGFMSQMLGPINQTNPYYSINVSASDNSWTAKFVITAANSWDTAQQTWLQTTLAQPTTYTFVVRHEASDATPPLPPGVAGVDALLSQYPYTLLIAGHAHTYGHYSDAPQTIVIGNGGAPLSSKDYGFGLLSQRCDGNIVVDEIDYMTGATDSEFHFVVTPTGQITQ